MRTYDTRAFYIPDPASERRSLSTASADEEDFEETSDIDESYWGRGCERSMILSDLRELSFTGIKNYLVKLISYKILNSIKVFITDIY